MHSVVSAGETVFQTDDFSEAVSCLHRYTCPLNEEYDPFAYIATTVEEDI